MTTTTEKTPNLDMRRVDWGDEQLPTLYGFASDQGIRPGVQPPTHLAVPDDVGNGRYLIFVGRDKEQLRYRQSLGVLHLVLFDD